MKNRSETGKTRIVIDDKTYLLVSPDQDPEEVRKRFLERIDDARNRFKKKAYKEIKEDSGQNAG